MTEIEKTEGEIKVLQAKLELLKEMENFKTPVEEAYKKWWGDYPPTTPSVDNYEDTRWSAFQKGYTSAQEDWKVGEYQPSPQHPEEVADGLRDAMRQAKEEGVFDEPTKPMDEVVDRLENKYKDAEENTASYINDDVVNRMLKEWEENPPDFLKFELGKTLEELICKCMVDYNSTIPVGLLEDILNNIEEWLPDFQSHEGSQNIDAIIATDGFNDALKKIKSKLRNKK